MDIASQQVVEVPAATPRDTHLVTIDGEERAGLLLEMAATNKITYSEDFSNAAWLKQDVTVTASQLDPAGGTSARTLDATVNGGYLRFTVSFTANATKTIAVYLRAGTAAVSRIRLYDDTASVERHVVSVTWTNGVPTLATFVGSGTLFPVESLGGRWYRVMISAASVVAANSNLLYFYPAGPSATGTAYAYGFQAEDGAFASSYVPTSGATATRSADSFYWNYPHAPQGMFVYCRFIERGTIAAPDAGVFQIGDAGAAERLLVYRSTSTDFYTAYHHNGASAVTSTLAVKGAVGDTLELLLRLNAGGNVQLIQSVNGAAVTEAATSGSLALPSTFTAPRFYLNSEGVSEMGANSFAEIKAVKYDDVVGATAQARMDELRGFELGPNRELLSAA
ncbi:MAG: phage head spike fiber domain-containing protein [Gemmatimonadaceae bacterium]